MHVEPNHTRTIHQLPTDPDDGIASYQWTQTLGPPVTFSDPTSINPTFLTPPVNNGLETLIFRLTITDLGDLQSTDDITVTVTDNGIIGFPADVVTLQASTGENYGMKVDNGGAVTGLQTLDPSTIADSSNRPDDLPYGLIDLQAKTDITGGTMKVTIYLPSPTQAGYKWFKYSPTSGWYDFSGNAAFNADSTQATLTLTDGGAGDDDGIANGVIINSTGLGYTFSPISVSAGWNLISLPKQPANISTEDVLSSIAGKYESVWAYINGQWKSYDPEQPFFGDLTTMQAGIGYWIKMKAAGELTVSGSETSASITLYDGWNLVGYNGSQITDIEEALESIAGKYISVWAYINGQWKSFDPN